MFRRLFTVLILAAAQVASQVCFTQQQVQTSTTLFTYQGNVYDITNYNHPGGAAKLNLVIGQVDNFLIEGQFQSNNLP